MKTTHFLLGSLLALLLMATSCKDGSEPDPEPQHNTAFELVFQGYFGGQEFFVDFPYYIEENKLYYQFESYKFYISDLTLVADDGTETLLDTLAFVDFAENHLPFGKKPGTGKTAHAGGEYIRYTGVEPGSYKGVRFGVGITPERNTGDGSPYVNDPDHPLHPSQNMNWGMGPGFIFQSLLGVADSSDDAFDQDRVEMIYHLGLDEHY
ncbi:MAG: MbnP family protein, partial [Bacteroidota bacterium]